MWDHIAIAPQDQVKVIVRFGMVVPYSEELTLRKGLEWEDFQFLMNSRLKDQEWEAWINNRRWTGRKEVLHCDAFKQSGRHIDIFPPLTESEPKEEFQSKEEEEAWDKLRKNLRYVPWSYDWPTYGEEQEVTVSLQIQQDSKELLVRVPKESEWALIKSYANNRAGQGKWTASLGCDHRYNYSRTPTHGDIVRIWTIEKVREFEFWSGRKKQPPNPVWEKRPREAVMSTTETTDSELQKEETKMSIRSEKTLDEEKFI
jgi:hypothetical protein